MDLGTKAVSRATAANGRLVIATGNGDVVALDTESGREVWNRRDMTTEGRAKLAVSGRTLCVTGKNLSALDIVSGKPLWTADNGDPPAGTPVFWGPPTIHGKHVYASLLQFPLRYDLRTAGGATGHTAACSNAIPPAPWSSRATASGRSPSTRHRAGSTSSTSPPPTARHGCSGSSRTPAPTGSKGTGTAYSSWTGHH
ncbi:PQQ-binding-like beta-propeller repeat protein [Streptomyces niveus]|uniref:outer membrane protein assembly factor BamB family protein n=1 Tax=Streptomyces niveus TaxID=193462 RepID=UPI0036D2E58F